LKFIKHLPLKGWGPDYTSYITLVELFWINGKKQDAQLVIDEMLMRLQRMDKSQFRHIVKFLCANGLARRARDVIDVAVRKFGLDADMTCCSTLIAAYMENNQMDLVIELVDFMASIRQFPDVRVFNTIITGLSKMGHAKEAVEVLDNMHSFGVCPDDSTYNRTIACLWRNGEKKMALKMLERMREKGWPGLHRITYNTIMTCLSHEGMVDEALELLQVMKANGIAADAPSYNALLLRYCNMGRMEEAMQLFEEMLEKGRKPLWRTYSIILRAAISAGYKAKVLDLINEMNEKGILSKDSMTFLKDDSLSDHKSE
jgi:pentatricopeptide repeat protein